MYVVELLSKLIAQSILATLAKVGVAFFGHLNIRVSRILAFRFFSSSNNTFLTGEKIILDNFFESIFCAKHSDPLSCDLFFRHFI